MTCEVTRKRGKHHKPGDGATALKEKKKEGTVTLVYAARDAEHNGELVLKVLLQGH
jgi:uncharacterized protein YeaO (DUF488 family)